MYWTNNDQMCTAFLSLDTSGLYHAYKSRKQGSFYHGIRSDGHLLPNETWKAMNGLHSCSNRLMTPCLGCVHLPNNECFNYMLSLVKMKFGYVFGLTARRRETIWQKLGVTLDNAVWNILVACKLRIFIIERTKAASIETNVSEDVQGLSIKIHISSNIM